MPNIDVKSGSDQFTQKNVSKALYKVVEDSGKVLNSIAASAAYMGLDALGAAESLREGVNFIKEKTQFNFGKCGKVEFTGKFKAESCLMDNSRIELNSDYKLDSVTLKFKWSL